MGLFMIIVFMLGIVLSADGFSSGLQSGPMIQDRPAGPLPETREVPAKAEPEKIIPGPQNIKERTAILVFLGWMWASIAVLVYLLRLKIKEVDHLHRTRYFSPRRK